MDSSWSCFVQIVDVLVLMIQQNPARKYSKNASFLLQMSTSNFTLLSNKPALKFITTNFNRMTYFHKFVSKYIFTGIETEIGNVYLNCDISSLKKTYPELTQVLRKCRYMDIGGASLVDKTKNLFKKRSTLVRCYRI